MLLQEKQALFLRLQAELILWVFAQGWVFTPGEGRITSPRKYRLPSGAVVVADDAVHMKKSLHHIGLAQDLNLFIDGVYIADGGHPVWTIIGTHWEAMNPLCRWGGRFRDANHFSLEHEGRA